MEDFSIMGFVGAVFGFVVGLIIAVNLFEQPKMSGSYMTYCNKIYNIKDLGISEELFDLIFNCEDEENDEI